MQSFTSKRSTLSQKLILWFARKITWGVQVSSKRRGQRGRKVVRFGRGKADIQTHTKSSCTVPNILKCFSTKYNTRSKKKKKWAKQNVWLKDLAKEHCYSWPKLINNIANCPEAVICPPNRHPRTHKSDHYRSVVVIASWLSFIVWHPSIIKYNLFLYALWTLYYVHGNTSMHFFLNVWLPQLNITFKRFTHAA